jgi:hypothetical protein
MWAEGWSRPVRRRENLFPPLGFKTQTVQPKASHYTDYIVLAAIISVSINKKFMIIILAQWTMTFQSLMQIHLQPSNLPHSHQLATVGLLVYKRQQIWGCKTLLKNME